MRRMIAVLITMLVACHDPTASPSDILRASARDGALTIENLSAKPVRYLVEGAQARMLSLLFCTTAHPCGLLLPGKGRVVIPYREIIGYTPDEHTAVIAYSLDVGTVAPDGLLRLTVELP